jgi:hypothetical protein
LEMWYSVNVIRPSFTSADVGVILFKGTLRWQYENTVDWGLFEFIFSWPSYDLNPRKFLTNCTIINRHFVPPSKFVICFSLLEKHCLSPAFISVVVFLGSSRCAAARARSKFASLFFRFGFCCLLDPDSVLIFVYMMFYISRSHVHSNKVWNFRSAFASPWDVNFIVRLRVCSRSRPFLC